MRLKPGQQIGHYEVVSAVGAGGMGEVYRAVDRRLGRAVALKVLPSHVPPDDERARRFMGEARSASAFNHPNVATIYDVGDSDGVGYIAMELVEGETLAHRLGQGTLALAEIVEIATQLVDALDAAHAQGIMHRDIKPANLMLTSRQQVKVLDFGLAKNTDAQERDRPARRSPLGPLLGGRRALSNGHWQRAVCRTVRGRVNRASPSRRTRAARSIRHRFTARVRSHRQQVSRERRGAALPVSDRSAR